MGYFKETKETLTMLEKAVCIEREPNEIEREISNNTSIYLAKAILNDFGENVARETAKVILAKCKPEQIIDIQELQAGLANGLYCGLYGMNYRKVESEV